METLSQKIRALALDVGFDKVGIANADALTQESARLREWLASGYHADMAWMEREPEKRTDPRSIFPAARSVVVVAQNYFTDLEHDNDPDRGKISRYAWGDDYHDIVREKLLALLAAIQSIAPHVTGKACVDTAPMMDKAWAQRAGLGWIGKHSNLITTDLGSWVFIGELILDADLDYDTAVVEDHCGTCTRCLDACPTDAIVAPYVVDAQKCISYATIELRSPELPEQIAAAQEGWLYGCDICQDVCPWNRFETPTGEKRFLPRLGETTLDLAGITEMDHDRYVERFRRSAIKRAKLSGLKRNAASLINAAENG